MSIIGSIKFRFQTLKANNPAMDVSANVQTDSFVVAAPGGTADGLAMIRDSTQSDGWGFSTLKKVWPLGGSRQVSLPMAAGVQDAIDYLDMELDGGVAGRPAALRVECRTMNAGTSITPKLRNITDGTDACSAAACTSTTFAGTNGVQTVAFTLAIGLKKYRLQGTPSDALNPTFIIGYLETGN